MAVIYSGHIAEAEKLRPRKGERGPFDTYKSPQIYSGGQEKVTNGSRGSGSATDGRKRNARNGGLPQHMAALELYS